MQLTKAYATEMFYNQWLFVVMYNYVQDQLCVLSYVGKIARS